MQIELVKDAAEWTLRLAGPVSVASAVALHRVASEAAAAPGPLVVDVAGVSAIDTAGTQVLIALGRRPAGRVQVRGASPALRETWRRLGADGAFA
jgi:anti-anti-sigma regulatory factor